MERKPCIDGDGWKECRQKGRRDEWMDGWMKRNKLVE